MTVLEGRAVPAAVLVTAADAGGGPHVIVRADTNQDGTAETVTASFMAYGPAFRGGVRVALGDFDGDGRDELVTVNGSARYAYDPLGRRVKEGTRALYYTPAWQVVEERESGVVVARNVWSPVYVDALVLRDRDADGSGGGTLEERLYAVQDANWNVTALVSAAGAVVERYVQDPYGRFDVKDAAWGARADSAYAWVYLHQGGRYDPVAGLYHFRHRDYSPTLMRFLQNDPIGFDAGDPNRYRAVFNNPQTLTDPTGLDVWYLINYQSFFAMGQGHAAVIIGPIGQPFYDKPTYVFYSYNGLSPTRREYSSLEEAFKDPKLAHYDAYILYEMSGENTMKSFRELLHKHLDARKYRASRHNCGQAAGDIIRAGDGNFDNSLISPKNAYNRNKDNATKSGTWPPK
jgi:RHS repeat-associated protein